MLIDIYVCFFPEFSFMVLLGELLTFYGHIKSAQQRTIIQQHGDWYSGC